ncbi:MAG: hypothetical protein K9M19_07385, partial [Candidatus Marinimicrobia bacterium]|nr:hypothetical protein [Candidatus Neomarinimicrobiota bacterium]
MKRLLILMGLFGLLTGITWGQTHFQTVYSGNPYLAMNIYVTSAVIEDVALTAGDEIGIFDGEYCVGAAVVEGEIDPYLAMVAATDEASTPEVDGFTPGNPIIFRIWDSENDMEITNVAATYALGDGTFTSQGSAMVDLVGNLPEDHFTPVYFGNPYLAMNFYITAASIDDVELGAGDEIGIFDGDVCVGAGVLSAPIGDYLALVAATDDPGTPEIDGFTPGHTISYRLWDAGQELEIENVEAVYALGDGIFSSQGSAMADLAGSTSTTVPTVAHPIPDIVLDEDAAGFDVADLDTVFANPAPEDPLIYTITNAEAGVQLTLVNTSILHLELGPDWYGGATVTITASNSNSESVDDAFEITVNAVNDAPQLVSIPDQTTVEDSSIVVSIGATDVDFDLNAAETLTFTLTNNTNESLVDVAVTDDNLNDDLAELVLTVQANQHGSATITVVVTDAAGLGNSGDFTLTVNPVNDAPVLGQIQDQSTVEDSSISVSLSASDLDFDLDASETLTFTVSDNTNEGLVVAT